MAPKAAPNDSGVIWATSKSGALSIAVAQSHGGGWAVWALYTGTHDLAPVSKKFTTETAARAYANGLWRNR